MKDLKVILAEDHLIVRDGIRLLLERMESIHVVGEATNGTEVLEMLNQGLEADVVLTDISMPEMDGISLIKALKTAYPDIKVVILSMLDQQKYIIEAFSEGALGYLLKNTGLDELVFAIRQASMGQKYLCSELSFKYMDDVMQRQVGISAVQHPLVELSSREVEVLNLIAEGLTNNEISDQLFLSRRTVEGHRQALIEKTGVRNTAALIRYAVLNGFVK
jgi:two-component system response regulator NreC